MNGIPHAIIEKIAKANTDNLKPKTASVEKALSS